MKMRVLIVEDDRATAQAILKALQVDGIDAGFISESGEEAIDAVKHHPYEAVVLDTTLPGISGFDVIEIIRHKIGNPYDMKQVPILVLSEDTNIESKVKALGLGANDYMNKPFHRGELVARLKALHRSRTNWRAEALAELAIGTGELARRTGT